MSDYERPQAISNRLIIAIQFIFITYFNTLPSLFWFKTFISHKEYYIHLTETHKIIPNAEILIYHCMMYLSCRVPPVHISRNIILVL